MNGTRTLSMLTCLAGGLGPALLAGCTEYRIEYHRRPAYYEQASEEELPDRIVMPDGTVIVYVDDFTESSLAKASKTAGDDEEDDVEVEPLEDDFDLAMELDKLEEPAAAELEEDGLGLGGSIDERGD